jgi:hypothetical protein
MFVWDGRVVEVLAKAREKTAPRSARPSTFKVFRKGLP